MKSIKLPSCNNLFNLKRYLKRYPQNCQPAAFEYLVACALSQILYLPMQTKDTENNTIKHRVIWYGSVDKARKTISKSPSGADCICFAYGYNMLIECTLRNGANQWRREFVESLNHYNDFMRVENIDKKNIYLFIIAPKLHESTYTGFKQKVIEGLNIIILEPTHLAKICDISKIVLSIRHLDLRRLFNELVEELKLSISLKSFKTDLRKSIYQWRKNLLKISKTVFFGLRAYEAMIKVKRSTGRSIIGTSEIITKFHRDRKLKDCMKLLGGEDLTSFIKEGLLSERLAYLIPTPDEALFCIVNRIDFTAIGLRLIRAVRKI